MPSERNISTLRRSSSNARREIEAGRAQLPDRRLLEVARQVVVAPGPHDEQIPADLVAPQPRLGELVHAVRARGEQHDPQLGREQVEEPAHLFDDRVFAARVEERAPVRRAAPRCSAGASTRRRARRRCRRRPRGRDRPVRRARSSAREGTASRRPTAVSVLADHPSSGAAARYRDLMLSTMPGSASVVVSPSTSSSATLRNSRRMILPERGLRQLLGEEHRLRLRDRADELRDVVAQLLAQRVGRRRCRRAGSRTRRSPDRSSRRCARRPRPRPPPDGRRAPTRPRSSRCCARRRA